MAGLSSTFTPGSVDTTQDYFEALSTLDTTNATASIAPASGVFNSVDVKNPSVCKTLVVTLTLSAKDGSTSTEDFIVCPGEVRQVGFGRASVTQADIAVLDEGAVATPVQIHNAYPVLGALTAADVADDGGSLQIRVSFLNY